MAYQKDRVLAALTNGPVCALTEWDPPIRRLSARIFDLTVKGWDIDTFDCSQHSHGSKTIEYVLLNSPGWMSPRMASYATPPMWGWKR